MSALRAEPVAGLTRRGLILGGAALVAGTGLAWSLGGQMLLYDALRPEISGGTLNAADAHRLVAAGALTLVDIRRPDEWSATGSPEGAIRLDMRRADFIEALAGHVRGARDTPIAVICARGVRSARLSNRLAEAGFTGIIDIPEGMLGTSAGPGWLARGLPVNRDG
ncbi:MULTISPECIES: rhodanese-like domain-containing protein [Paracoccaceae]|jgi:rhodanese-related sulfurtransferase|uniref:rhodanese-like domain-containing protein n=1 Tax=Rhodobacterales TaxID=204455 RepID=UPI001D0BBA63|nr:rhodanese-like domain-containing protein [Boseongicola sp. H5]